MGPFLYGEAVLGKESLLWFTVYLLKFHLPWLLPFLQHLIVSQLPPQKFTGLFIFHLSICSPQTQRSFSERLALRSYNRNLAANAWSQGTGSKWKHSPYGSDSWGPWEVQPRKVFNYVIGLFERKEYPLRGPFLSYQTGRWLSLINYLLRCWDKKAGPILLKTFLPKRVNTRRFEIIHWTQ